MRQQGWFGTTAIWVREEALYFCPNAGGKKVALDGRYTFWWLGRNDIYTDYSTSGFRSLDSYLCEKLQFVSSLVEILENG